MVENRLPDLLAQLAEGLDPWTICSTVLGTLPDCLHQPDQCYYNLRIDMEYVKTSTLIGFVEQNFTQQHQFYVNWIFVSHKIVPNQDAIDANLHPRRGSLHRADLHFGAQHTLSTG
jgi:hypothetical protein